MVKMISFQFTPDQEFNLHMLEEDVAATVRSRDYEAWAAAMVALTKYVAGQKLTWHNFRDSGRSEFLHASTVAGFISFPEDFPDGTAGGKILEMAGLF